jgi:lipopolysaccharide export system protein LptA
MLRIRFLLCVALLALLSAKALSAAETRQESLQDLLQSLKIISADKLSFQEGESELSGNVKIQIDQYQISAPKVVSISSKDSKESVPSLITFSQEVLVESETLKVKAPLLEINLADSLFKCTANQDTRVQSEWRDPKKPGEDLTVISDYQEYSLHTQTAKASGGTNLLNKDLKISSDEIEFKYSNTENAAKKLEYVVFTGKVFLTDKDKRIESEELFYLPQQKIMKASGNVRILYIAPNREGVNERVAHLFAGEVIYETDHNLLTAFATQSESIIRIYSGDMSGQAKQASIDMNSEVNPGKLNQAVLSRNAFAQAGDKAIKGEEIIFDIKNQNVSSSLGRPMTQIFK